MAALIFWTTGSTVLNSFAATVDKKEFFDQAHSKWTAVLRQNVVQSGAQSRVKYAKLKLDAGELDSYLRALEKLSKPDFDQFTQSQKLAFLINAYNAFTVKFVIDNYPIASIKDAGSIFKSPWKKKFISLLGQQRNLDEIEHEMIRPVFGEPRIHFALVCASVGCPALRPEAYIAEKLEAQLEDSARVFLGDQSKNRYLAKEKKLELSSIFKWYGDDFRKKPGSLEAFVASRLTSDRDQQEVIKSYKATVSYLEYDWSLNDAK